MHTYNNDDIVKTAIVADILMMGSVCDGNGEKWTNSRRTHDELLRLATGLQFIVYLFINNIFRSLCG